jgi:hypothetical protein
LVTGHQKSKENKKKTVKAGKTRVGKKGNKKQERRQHGTISNKKILLVVYEKLSVTILSEPVIFL